MVYGFHFRVHWTGNPFLSIVYPTLPSRIYMELRAEPAVEQVPFHKKTRTERIIPRWHVNSITGQPAGPIPR